jgi:hypothetical protein
MSRCRACGELLRWETTASGRRKPLNVKAVTMKISENETKHYAAGTPHFATCPAANEFRRVASRVIKNEKEERET